MPDCLRLSMWSGPRNVSTALMYSFRERTDTTVVDEPLYGHYLRVTNAEHPGARDVMAQMLTDGMQVVQEVLLAPCDKPVRFFKNMAHHLTGLDRTFLKHLTNMLLIRDPREMLPSLIHQIASPTLRDTGLKEQVEILKLMLREGHDPVVLDAKELLLDPANVLRQACNKLGIPYEERMLHWQPGPKPEDGVWAPHWYHNVHASSGFAPYRAKQEAVPEWLEPLLQTCLPLYDRLYAHALRAS